MSIYCFLPLTGKMLIYETLEDWTNSEAYAQIIHNESKYDVHIESDTKLWKVREGV